MWGMRLARATARGAMTPVTAALACCVAAGCTSAATHVAGTAPATAARTTPAGAAPPLPARAVPSPGCTSAVSGASELSSVRSAMLPVPGNPFGVVATPDGRWAFVAVQGVTGGSSVEVLRLDGAAAPVLVRSITVPGTPLGETITPDGRYLLAADGAGAVVISVARAEAGTAGAVLGTLAAPGATGAAASAIEAAVSADGRFAFVTLEYDQQAAVFNLGRALADGFGAADYVGGIPLGQAAVGMAVSPDGRWLYATSEVESSSAPRAAAVARPADTAPPTGSTAGTTAGPKASAAAPGTAPGEPPGTLTVIDLRRAETDPAGSVVATVDAGCQPVRVITAADGTQVWVTARGSDDVLCFSAARLRADPSRALVAAVRVGEAPVGLAAVRGGSLLVVADSDRFAAVGASSDLEVVNVASALAGRPAVVGEIGAGAFPRDMALAPDGTLLVSDYQSDELEAVGVASIPGG